MNKKCFSSEKISIAKWQLCSSLAVLRRTVNPGLVALQKGGLHQAAALVALLLDAALVRRSRPPLRKRIQLC